MSIDSVSEAFRLEALRDKLASQNSLQAFKKTYSRKSPEIPDLNSNILWDELNSKPFPTPESDPMGFDRSTIVSNWIKKDSKSNSTILNVGFGSGSLEDKLSTSANNYHWYGIDISEKSVKTANEKFPFGKFKKGDIAKLPFKNNKFDLIIVSEVLEHIPPSKVFRSLKEIHRVLKPNGKLIVTVPVNEGLQDLIKEGINTNAHVRSYTISILLSELFISGFRLKKLYKLYAFRKLYYLKKQLLKVFTFMKKPNNLLLLLYKP